ncbi:MAG: ABC transporter substrate-binding protein [Oscillospiraceae bacterium]|nr:ABC transporter substrate-binding protein [Oscillospiraceae bacterium]
MRRLTAGLLCVLLTATLLAGCQKPNTAHVPTGDGLTWDEDYTGPVNTHPEEEQEQSLTLTYYPGITLNPYSCTDFTNRTLFSLLYQGLFTVDRDYNVEPMLCKSYRISEDMRQYTFYIEENVIFSDGAVLKPEDVVSSLNTAKESVYYGGRFLHMKEVTLQEDGGIQISLDTPCEDLPVLLDIPIVQASQVASDEPSGTGPYYLDKTTGNPCLRRRNNWWCKGDMIVTASTIALLEAQSNPQIRDAFQFSDLSLVCADPGSDSYADYRCDYELWDCENGMFLYIAFCKDSEFFSDPEVKAALTYAIDRDRLVGDFYRGYARSATLPASPNSPYYSQALADKYKYDGKTFHQIVSDKGLQGSTITFLVNSDDSLRLRVARAIRDMLEEAGLQVEMKEVNTAKYKESILYRTFDLYLGQTVLSNNMDLSAFFHTTGVLSYGGVDDPAAYTLCLQALENYGNYYTLHKTVMDQGLICPVLFRSYAVYAERGLLTGLTPARDNVFWYSIGKNMEQALIRQ